MESKKYRFNVVDAVIAVVLIAALTAVGYRFYTDSISGGDFVPVRYVVEVEDVREELTDKVMNGQSAYSETTGQFIGTVAVSENRAAQRAFYDSGTAQQSISEVPGMRVMYITFTADASLTDEGYICGGESLRTGSKIKIMLPDFYCEGSCVSVEAAG